MDTVQESERDRLVDQELAKHPAPTAQSIQEAYEAVERRMAEGPASPDGLPWNERRGA